MTLFAINKKKLEKAMGEGIIQPEAQAFLDCLEEMPEKKEERICKGYCKCPDCHVLADSFGSIPIEKEERCMKCDGKELFDMVYQWGKVGIVTDHTCYAFQEALKDLCNGTGKEPRKDTKSEDSIHCSSECILKLQRYEKALQRIIDFIRTPAPKGWTKYQEEFAKSIFDIALKALAEKGEHEDGCICCACGVDELIKNENQSPQTRWKPETNEVYFSVTEAGCVEEDYWGVQDYEEDMYEAGNVFKTRAEALTMAEKTRKLWRGL